MPDQLADFFRCEETADGWDLQIATVAWPHPHEPELEWSTFRQWKTQPNKGDLTEARHAATSDTRYFSACTRCHELTNAGHMHDAQTCQSCAERHLGVVH